MNPNETTVDQRLKRELASFDSIWAGGYFEGDPLELMARSTYGQLGYMSILRATYLACIKPYVDGDSTVLELGPGRGAWTKTMLNAREIWAVDALSEEHNGFYRYLGDQPHVRYIQVDDFTLRDVPDGHFSYMFSFGALCHVSFAGITQYAESAFKKLQPGARCFWMIADYDNYNAAVTRLPQLSPWGLCGLNWKSFLRPRGLLLRALIRSDAPPQHILPDTDQEPAPGRWYHSGTNRTVKMLEQVGYRVLDADMGVNHRDPVIHFVRP